MMQRSAEELRVRIQVNNFIKFCMRVNRNSTVNEFKYQINGILKHSYHIRLPDFALRIADFELLDIYRVGEIIDDNEVIVVDPFNVSKAYQSFKSENHVDQSLRNHPKQEFPNKAELNNEYPYSGVSNFKAIKKSLSINNRPTNDLIFPKNKVDQEPPSPVMAMSDAIQKPSFETSPIPKAVVDQMSFYNSKPDAGFTLPKVEQDTNPKEKMNINKLLNKTKEKQVDTIIPPRPDNFKGFVVKKSDLVNKSGNTRFEEQGTFKSLKKRKIEEDNYEIS